MTMTTRHDEGLLPEKRFSILRAFFLVGFLLTMVLTASEDGIAQKVLTSCSENKDYRAFKGDLQSDKSKYHGLYQYDPGLCAAHGAWTQYELFVDLAGGVHVTYWEGWNYEEKRTGRPVRDVSITGNLIQGMLPNGKRFRGEFVTVSLDRGRTRTRGIVRLDVKPYEFYQFLER